VSILVPRSGDNCGGRVVGVEPREKVPRLAREAVAKAGGSTDSLQIYGRGDPANRTGRRPGLVDVILPFIDGLDRSVGAARARSVLDGLATPDFDQHGMWGMKTENPTRGRLIRARL